MSEERHDTIWQAGELVDHYLDEIRSAVPYHADQIEMMARVITADRPEIANFLDLGCGDGLLGAVLLQHYPEARGVLADFSAPMLNAAREKLIKYGDQLTLMELDYSDPVWTDAMTGHAPFDVIVSGYSIHHQPNDMKRSLYGEIFNLLKPGGVFVHVEHVSSATPWLEDQFWVMFFDSVLAAERARGSDKSMDQIKKEFYSKRSDEHSNMLAPLEVQCDWLRDLGFEDVDCYFKVLEFAVFGGRKPAAQAG
jgi:SAM-dependent methyltransferase